MAALEQMVAAIAFGNATSLPFVFLTTMRQQLAYLFEVSGTGSKLNDAPTNDPVVYLSMYLLVYPIVQWVGGSFLLPPTPSADSLSAVPGHASTVTDAQLRASASNLLGAMEGEEQVMGSTGAIGRAAALAPTSVREAAGEAGIEIGARPTNQESCMVPFALPLSEHDELPSVRVGARIKEAMAIVWAVARRILVPPVTGTLLGVLMGVLPPTYWLFCGGTYPHRLLNSESCPASTGAVLGWLTQSIATLGNAAGRAEANPLFLPII